MNAWKAAYMAKPGAKERRVKYQRRRTYGISEQEQDRLMASQDGKCACCGEELIPGRGTHLDHDHGTEEIRAFVCNFCNSAFGSLKDDPDRALNAAAYLITHRRVTNPTF